jgi:hypothetical protein
MTASAGGVKLDGRGNLFAAGSLDGDTFVAELTTPDLSTVFSQTLAIQIGGVRVPSAGADIAVKPGGKAYIADTFTMGSNLDPAIVSFDNASQTTDFHFFPSSGNKGNGYGMTVDAAGNAYLGFTFMNAGDTISNLEVARFDGSLNMTGAVPLTFGTMDGFGYGVQVDTFGLAYISRVGGDPIPGGNLGFSKVNLNQGTLVEDQGSAFGANDDEGRHLILDQFYKQIDLAGATNSTDFSNTMGSFQDHNEGGYDGILVQYGNVL